MHRGKASRKSTIWAWCPRSRSRRSSSRPAPSCPPPILAETTRTRLSSTAEKLPCAEPWWWFLRSVLPFFTPWRLCSSSGRRWPSPWSTPCVSGCCSTCSGGPRGDHVRAHGGSDQSLRALARRRAEAPVYELEALRPDRGRHLRDPYRPERVPSRPPQLVAADRHGHRPRRQHCHWRLRLRR